MVTRMEGASMSQKAMLWAAVVCGVVAGVIALVVAVNTKSVAFAAWGVTFIAGSIIAAYSGAKGRPDGKLSPPTIGAKFTQIPTTAWLIIAAMVVTSAIVSIAAPPNL